MNCTLAALNAKYAHTNPAIRALKKAAGSKAAIVLKEYTINMQIQDILADLYHPDTLLYGFSVYIWNIEAVLKLVRLIKKLNSGVIVVLGGPEVSFECESLLFENPAADYIIAGEGEAAFPVFLDFLHGLIPAEKVPSLVYRSNGAVCANEKAVPCDLNALPIPYDDLYDLKRRVIYYESSRGCPFSCAFCLSSVSEGVRFKDLELVKKDIDAFIQAGSMKVKFVDRTFNADKRRAKEIFRYVSEKDCATGFHFEISAALLDEETLEILSKSPPGRIQLEAGIQSVNPVTLAAIHRPSDFSAIKHNLKKIISGGNIHTHVDIIAGLPYESYGHFKTSFDSAFFLMPDNLQLGFLKLLKGSELREKAGLYGMEYMPFAPYTVLKTNDIRFEELHRLHQLEDLLEKYYNSGLFKHTVYYLACRMQSAYNLFEKLLDFTKAKKPDGEISRSDLAFLLFEFACAFADAEIVKDLMRFDICKAKVKAPFPVFLQNELDVRLEKEYYKSHPKTARSFFRIACFGIDLTELEKTGNIVKSRSVWAFDYASGQKERLDIQ